MNGGLGPVYGGEKGSEQPTKIKREMKRVFGEVYQLSWCPNVYPKHLVLTNQ